MKQFGLLIVLILLISGVVLAQEATNTNDPNINEDANACFEGGEMEGKCNSEIEWVAGWYLIRFHAGIFTREEIPSFVVWVLPPESVPEIVISTVADTGPVCINNGSQSLILTHALNTFSNYGLEGNPNCITSGSFPSSARSVVTGNDDTEALANCRNVFTVRDYRNHTVQLWTNSGYNAPSTWWRCRAEGFIS